MILHLKVVEAVDIPKMDIISKSDPYCIVSLSNSVNRQRTKTIDNTDHPVWNQEFHFPIKHNSNNTPVSISITVYDEDTFSKDDIISSIEIPVNDYLVGRVYDEWYSLYPAKKVKKGGRIHLVVHVAPKDAKPFQSLPNSMMNPNMVNPCMMNPTMSNPALMNPNMSNPAMMNPNMVNSSMSNPVMVNPNMTNPAMMNPNMANPAMMNPNMSNPTMMSPNMTNPAMMNPNMTNPAMMNQNVNYNYSAQSQLPHLNMQQSQGNNYNSQKPMYGQRQPTATQYTPPYQPPPQQIAPNSYVQQQQMQRMQQMQRSQQMPRTPTFQQSPYIPPNQYSYNYSNLNGNMMYGAVPPPNPNIYPNVAPSQLPRISNQSNGF